MKKKTRDETKSKKGTRKKNQPKALVAELDQLCIDVDSSDSELTATCPSCGGLVFDEDKDETWICCDKCDLWYDLKCSNVSIDGTIFALNVYISVCLMIHGVFQSSTF